MKWPVFINPDKLPFPVKDLETFLGFTNWSLQSRTGLEMPYSGQTTSTRIAGGVVIRAASPKEIETTYPSLSPLWTKGVNASSGNAWFEILLNTLWLDEVFGDSQKETVFHELLHTPYKVIKGIKFGHVEDDHAVMFRTSGNGRYNLSMTDYMPIQIGGSFSHAELSMENDLYIPEIQGMCAFLRYTWDGTYHTWKLAELTECDFPLGYTGASFDVTTRQIKLADVRGQTIRVRDVVLAPNGGDTWRLINAEVIT